MHKQSSSSALPGNGPSQSRPVLMKSKSFEPDALPVDSPQKGTLSRSRSGEPLQPSGASAGDLGMSMKSPSRSLLASPKVPKLSRPSSREQILNEFSSDTSLEANVTAFHQHGNLSGGAVTRVEFQVTVEGTVPGDRVVVTGSEYELGSWQPLNGVDLATDEGKFPLWSGMAALPSGQSLEYKYVIIREEGAVWEDAIENRMCTAEGTYLVLEDGRFNEERARLLNREFRSVEKGTKHSGPNFLDLEPVIDQSETIYIITYRLPLITHRDPTTGQLSFQWLSMLSDTKRREMDSTKVMRSMSRHATYVIESLRGLRDLCNVCFVGGLGVDVPEDQQEAVAEELQSSFNCIPVFLPRDEASEFEDFCHTVLKPLFHFVHPTAPEVCGAFQAGAKWTLYNAVNLKYVTPVVQNFNDGDCVFVFDLELLMAPTLLAARARTANVCFFFNTPFPSSEIFRTLPVRKQVLASLLNADFIQFHCFTYARHFLACCSTLLGLEYRAARGGLLHVAFNGQHCHIRASHVGIDAEALQQRLQEQVFCEEQRKWKETFDKSGKQVVLCGYDDLEPLSGITLKLAAFKSILSKSAEIRSNTLLVQVAIPLHDNRGHLMHPEYAEQVTAAAAEVEKEFPGSLLLLREKMPFAPRCALFAESDALVMAAVRHGLSLVPFEFAITSELGEKKGTMVLSEFAACSNVIPGAMRMNPWRDADLERAIVKVLRQPPHEQSHWHRQQMTWCKTNTVRKWAETILVDMKRLRQCREQDGGVQRTASNRVGLVKNTFKEISSHVLRQELVEAAYSRSKTRLVLVDVDLLIRPKEEMAEVTKEQSIKSLRQLVEEQGNFVFLLSSETPTNLLHWLGNVPGLDKVGLAAEDGYYYKWPGSPIDRWDVRLEVRADWKEMCSLMMQTYTERTTGTFIEGDKLASITWHFGSTNPEFGAIQGKELLNHLKDTMAHLPVEVVMGKSFVRVRHSGVTKGALVKHVLHHYTNRGGVDFILCLGDDRMDEDMFTSVHRYQQEASYRVYQGTEQEVRVFTCTVGRQPSMATYCLYTLDDVNVLLRGLSLQTKRRLRSATTTLNLSSLG